jgi:NAD(P)H-dependent FMN reductase
MKFTIISSSTRNERVSHRIALALEKQFRKSGHKVTIIDLLELDLPRFTERFAIVEEKPDNWDVIMEMLVASDGIIFLTPEYNGSFSSGLKNFIDVFAKQGFRGKPIGVTTGSTGSMGGVRAAYQLQQVILSLFAYPLPNMLTVGEMQNKFDSAGELIDESFLGRFEEFVDKFIEFTSRISN